MCGLGGVVSCIAVLVGLRCEEDKEMRQPVYLIVDCSTSMSGEPIECVRQAVHAILVDLLADLARMRMFYVSVITFADQAQQVVPLTEVRSLREPHLVAGGASALGAGLRLLQECISREIRKGDAPPLVYLMSNGRPTDNWETEAKLHERTNIIGIIGCVAGSDADESVLKRVACFVGGLNDVRPGALISPRRIMSTVFHTMRFPTQSASQEQQYDYFASEAMLAALMSEQSPIWINLRDRLNEIPSSGRGSFEHEEGGHRDQVNCSVFAPPRALPGESVLVQVFAHIAAQASEAQSLAQEFDAASRRRGVTSLATEVTRGSKLAFEITIKGVTIEDPLQELVWQGHIDCVQFGLSIPETQPPSTLLGKVLVSQNSVPIGRVLFILRVVAAATGQPDRELAREPCGTATRYNLAFISYASKDRPEVLRRVQMLSAVGIRYFQDLLDLDPGDHWAQEIFRHIDESDVMFLFWSSAAGESEWVRKEWQYGLEKKGDDYIRPVVIEGPPPPEAPAELRHLHFSDRVLYFLKHAE